MEVPSLAHLAMSSLVQHFKTGKISFDDLRKFPNIELSNQILSTFVDIPYTRICLKNFKGILKVSKIDLTKFRSIDEEDYDFVRGSNLKTLIVEVPDKDLPFYLAYDLSAFLSRLINKGTKVLLKSLTLINHQLIKKGWPESVGRMAPNLQNLNLSAFEDFYDSDFELVCQFFQNLKCLNIANTEVTSLDGISKLEKLEVLILEGVHLDTLDTLEDLFNCQTLTVLDLSGPASNLEIHIVETYLKCGKGLEELRFLNLAYTDVNEEMIKKILETHKKLEQVVVFETLLNSYSIHGVQLLNKSSHPSALECLRHFLTNQKADAVAHILNMIAGMVHHNEVGEADYETKMDYVRLAMEALEVFKGNMAVRGRAITCMSVIVGEELLDVMYPNDFTRLVDMLIEQTQKYYFTTDHEVMNCNWFMWTLLYMPNVLMHPVLKVAKLWKHAFTYVQKAIRIGFPYRENREITIVLKLFKRLNGQMRRMILEEDKILETIELYLEHTQLNEPLIPDRSQQILCSLDVIREALEIERCTDLVAEMRSEGGGCVDLLFSFVWNIRDPFSRKEATLRVFDIIATLVRSGYTKPKCLEYLKGQAVFMMGYLNETLDQWDPITRTHINADIAYHAVSTIAFMVKHSKLEESHESIFNRKSLDFCANIDHKLITAKINGFTTMLFLKKCLVDSKNPGLVSWALLTLRIVLERDSEMKRDSELMTLVENVRSDKKEILKLKEKVLDVMCDNFSHLLAGLDFE